jgi:hypothetical protein
MSENLILPPLLFSNIFPGYRGFQYLLYFFVFPVITIFFICKKSKFSRPGLQMNSHAIFTYSYPQLKIILIPTMIWSILFSFFTLIACTLVGFVRCRRRQFWRNIDVSDNMSETCPKMSARHPATSAFLVPFLARQCCVVFVSCWHTGVYIRRN